MNIILDISVLGKGFYAQHSRTGIARVIENLAHCLHEHSELNVSFSAFNAIADYVQTLKYLQIESTLNGSEINICPPKSESLNVALQKLAGIYPGPQVNLFPTKGLRFIINQFNFMLSGLDEACILEADIFHSPYFPFPKYVKGSPKLKKFITVYDLIPILYPQYFKFKKDHLIHKVVDKITPEDWVLTISHSTKDDLCNSCGIAPARVFVTHLAASDMFYPCKDKSRIAQVKKQYNIPDDPYMLSLCTLEPRKNIRRTIKCFLKMVQEQNIKDLNLVLVGTKGWDFEKIFAEIEKTSSMRERIIVTGYIPDLDLAPIYSGAMMFVYPSLYEGFGLPPLEAMQCGVPVITSNTSSLPEVVGDSGIMIDPLDDDDLTHAMWTLYNSPATRSELAEKSLLRAADFSWERCTQQTVGAYKTAMES